MYNIIMRRGCEILGTAFFSIVFILSQYILIFKPPYCTPDFLEDVGVQTVVFIIVVIMWGIFAWWACKPESAVRVIDESASAVRAIVGQGDTFRQYRYFD